MYNVAAHAPSLLSRTRTLTLCLKYNFLPHFPLIVFTLCVGMYISYYNGSIVRWQMSTSTAVYLFAFPRKKKNLLCYNKFTRTTV